LIPTRRMLSCCIDFLPVECWTGRDGIGTNSCGIGPGWNQTFMERDVPSWFRGRSSC